MNATRMIRAVTVAAVLAVAAVAGWVSYRHAVTVVTAHGETGWVGRMYPATIDGLIVAASMVAGYIRPTHPVSPCAETTVTACR